MERCGGRRRFRCIILLSFIALIGLSTRPARAAGPGDETVSGEVLVGLRTPKDEDLSADTRRLIARIGSVAGRQRLLSALRVRLRPGLTTGVAAASLRARPDIRYAEPNFILRRATTPNDPLFLENQWSLPTTGTDRAWDDWTPRRQIVIAIVDSGVQTEHPDLAGALFRDKSGRVIGTDFVSHDDDPRDAFGHGTHCAGIAVAQIDNALGIAGVAGRGNWIKLMPVRIMAPDGSATTSDVADGVLWAVDHGANVISLSMGTTAQSDTLKDALEYAWNRGCVVVAAAGNDGSSVEKYYPAAYPNVVSVAATDSADHIAGYSNRGDWVRVAAPGDGILSTTMDGGYGWMSGTSMAAPFVAGEIAVVWSQAPSLSNRAVSELVVASVVPLGKTFGRVDVRRAMDAALAVPTLDSVTIAPGSRVLGSVSVTGTVTLTAPAPPGGLTVTLAAENASVVTVPASVTVPPGGRSIPFPIGTSPVSRTQSATITARGGGATTSVSLSIVPLVRSIEVQPYRVRGGANADGIVTLTEAAPPGGVTVQLISDSASASVPGGLFIPGGVRRATFAVATKPVSARKIATISAKGTQRVRLPGASLRIDP